MHGHVRMMTQTISINLLNSESAGLLEEEEYLEYQSDRICVK